MGEVVYLDCITRLDLPPERVLSEAMKADLDGVVVLAFTKDGHYYGASSYHDGGDVLWLMEITRGKLLEWARE